MFWPYMSGDLELNDLFNLVDATTNMRSAPSSEKKPSYATKFLIANGQRLQRICLSLKTRATS